MANSAAISAGGVFVRIFAKDGEFQQAMARVQMKMQAVSQTLQRVGTGMSLGGAALGAPLVLAARQAATFQDALLGMQAAAGLSAEQVKALADEAKRLSVAMGVSPTTIANAFLELTKAGMSVEDVLAGAGRSAVEFARISGVDSQRAAVFMKTAMNVFGVSAEQAANILSAASDSSETSIEAMIESFSQVGSAGEAFGQSLFGISQAMAALAKSGIVGEEAGTAIKTMLTKLVAPTDDAKEALGRLGLSIGDFRDETGKLLPLVQIVGKFEDSLNRMGKNNFDKAIGDAALVDVFEQRGIKVMTALANIGRGGLDEIGRQMQAALPVSEKFMVMMQGITGQFQRLASGAERVAIAFGEAIQGPLVSVTDSLVKMLEVCAGLIQAFPKVAIAVSVVAAALVVLGTAAIVAALAIKGIAVVGAILAAIASPVGLVAAALLAVAAAAGYAGLEMSGAFEDLEAWGLRVQNIWEKVKITLDGVWSNMKVGEWTRQLDAADARLEERLMDLRRRRAAMLPEDPAARQGAAGAPSRDALLRKMAPDRDRKPLGVDPEARRKAAEALAQEDADYDQSVQQAVARTSDGFFRITKDLEGFGEAGKKVFDAYLERLGRLQKLATDGVLNPTSLEQEAALLEEQMAGIVQKMQEQPDGNRFTSAGTFGSTLGMFIGPQLADPAKRTADNTARIAGIAEQMLQELRAANPAGPAAALGGAGVPGAADAAQKAAAGAAAKANEGASIIARPLPGIKDGFASVVQAARETTAAVASNTRTLERMLAKLEGPGGVFV